MWKTSLTSSRFGYLIPLIIIKCSRCYFHNYRNSKSNFYLISLIYIMFLENALVAIMIPSFVFNSLGWEYIITFTTYHTLYFPFIFFTFLALPINCQAVMLISSSYLIPFIKHDLWILKAACNWNVIKPIISNRFCCGFLIRKNEW